MPSIGRKRCGRGGGSIRSWQSIDQVASSAYPAIAHPTPSKLPIFQTFSEIYPKQWTGLTSIWSGLVLGLNMLACRVGLSVVSKMAFVQQEHPNMLLVVAISDCLAAGVAFMCLGLNGKRIFNAFSDSYGDRRLKLYMLIGAMGSIATMLIQLSYRYASITTVNVFAVLTVPGAELVISWGLGRKMNQAQLLALFQLTAVTIAFISVFGPGIGGSSSPQSSSSSSSSPTSFLGLFGERTSLLAGLSTEDIFGFGLLSLYVATSTVAYLYVEKGCTKDRCLSEVMFFTSCFGFGSSLLGYLSLSHLMELHYALPNLSDFWTLASIILCLMAKLSIMLVQFYDEAATAAAVKPVVIATTAIIGSQLFGDEITGGGWILLGCIIVSYLVYESIKSAWMRTYVVVFPYHQHSNELLLGLQKRGFFKGYLNGYGGKVDPGEDPVEAAYRELEEESGLMKQEGMTLVGVKVAKGAIHFVFVCGIDDNGKESVCETEEAVPKFLSIPHIISQISRSCSEYALVATNVELVCRHLLGDQHHQQLQQHVGGQQPNVNQHSNLISSSCRSVAVNVENARGGEGKAAGGRRRDTANSSSASSTSIITRRSPPLFTPLAYKFEPGSDQVLLIPVEKKGVIRCTDPFYRAGL